MAVRDVSAELRDWHGRWARTPGLKRVASELAEARAPASLEEIHKRVQALEPGQAKGINGILVHHTERGFKVRLSKAQGGTRFYKEPHEAATAVHRLSHDGEPGPPRAPEPPRRPPAAPEPPRPSPGSGLTEDEKQAIGRAQVVSGNLYLKDYVPSPTEHKEIIKGMAIAKEKLGVDSPEHRNLVKAYRTSQLRRRKQSRAPAPEPPPSPPPSPPPAGKFDIGADVVYQGRNAKVVREYPGGGYLIEFEDGWRKVIRRPTELTPGKVAKEPAPIPPPLRPGVNWNYNTRNETVPGSREYVYTRAMENGYSSRESAAMITQAMIEGKSDVNNGMYVLYERDTGTLRLKVYVPPGGPKFTKEQARDIVREREKERE